MNITRRAFLVTTTAFTVSALFHPAASAEISPDSLSRDRWHQIWFQPMDKAARKIGRFTGLEHYNLPANTFLTLDHNDRARLRATRPGDGFKQERTTHFSKPHEGAWG